MNHLHYGHTLRVVRDCTWDEGFDLICPDLPFNMTLQDRTMSAVFAAPGRTGKGIFITGGQRWPSRP